jgi:hypothetical protein
MNKEFILSQCVDAVRSGRSTVQECLERYPALRDDLKPLLETTLRIQSTDAPLSGEARSRIRARLLAAMREPATAAREARLRPSRTPIFTLRLATTLGAVALAVTVAGGGTVFAAQRSLPGDPLYPVKTGSEHVRLALTVDRQDKANLHLMLARRRVDEIASGAHRGDALQTTAAERVAKQLDQALHQIAKSEAGETRDFMRRLSEESLHGQLTLDSLNTSSGPAAKPALQQVLDVLRRGKLIADVSYDNPSFMDSLPSVTDADLEEGHFKIAGTLTSTDGGRWKIDGLTLDQVDYSGDLPPVDTRVRTEGLTRNGKIYVTSVERDGDNTDEATIQGTFKGSVDGGSVWYVGGIAVSVPKGTNTPSTGDELHLRRPQESDKPGFSQVEAWRPDETRVVFSGELTAVDTNAKTITVVRAGTQIRVNIAGTVMRTDNKRPVTLSQLQSSLGNDLEIRGLSRKGNTLYATELIMDGGGR